MKREQRIQKELEDAFEKAYKGFHREMNLLIIALKNMERSWNKLED